MKTARQVALAGLIEVRRSGAWADLYLKEAIRKEGLDRRDAALATELLYGVLQQRALIDHTIAAYSSIKLKKVTPDVLDAMRIAVYQLRFMDRIPPSAAVDEAVREVRRRANPRAAGFANAVLRSAAAQREALPMPEDDGSDAYYAVRYSHPEELVHRLRLEYPDDFEAILRENNTRAQACCLVNTLKIAPAALIEALAQEGVQACPHPADGRYLLLRGLGDPARSAAHEKGLFYLQDAAAGVMTRMLAPEAGERILDVCAAPGGKSFAAAIAMGDAGEVVSRDVHAHKVSLVEAGAARLGLSSVRAEAGDARAFVPAYGGAFDRVICDVPCSGLGIIRKKPDIRYRAMEDIAAISAVQHDILCTAARYVKNRGFLLYSTCTIIREENEDVVRAFLSEHPAFQLCEQRTLLPHRDGTDGFFIAKLRKEGAPGA